MHEQTQWNERPIWTNNTEVRMNTYGKNKLGNQGKHFERTLGKQSLSRSQHEMQLNTRHQRNI